jgi:hypothetical protein|tara:strand:+ start:3159 stop:3281 length:123 start_codon:yes stop_codon:yes gene_type:complete
VVERVAPTFGGGDGDAQVILNPALSDEVIKTPWSQIDIKR